MPSPSDTVDRDVARLKRELEASLATLARYIEAQIDRAKVDDNGRFIVKSPFNAELARQMAERLNREIEERFGEINQGVRDSIANVLESVGTVLTEQGISENLTTPSEGLLALQMGDGLDALTQIKEAHSKALRATVLQLFQTTTTPTAAFNLVVEELGAGVSRALALVDTTVMAVDRTVSTSQAKDGGFEWFTFSGPVDDLTRGWCRDRVGKLFHESELDEVDNDTGPNPPSAFGGGYRCRHRWDAVDVSEIRQHPRFKGRSYRAP